MPEDNRFYSLDMGGIEINTIPDGATATFTKIGILAPFVGYGGLPFTPETIGTCTTGCSMPLEVGYWYSVRLEKRCYRTMEKFYHLTPENPLIADELAFPSATLNISAVDSATGGRIAFTALITDDTCYAKRVTSPSRIIVPAPATYTIRFGAEGYHGTTIAQDVVNRGMYNIIATLEPISTPEPEIATLKISSTPGSANVSIVDTATSSTIATITTPESSARTVNVDVPAPATYCIIFSKEGYNTITKTQSVEIGERYNISATLRPLEIPSETPPEVGGINVGKYIIPVVITGAALVILLSKKEEK